MASAHARLELAAAVSPLSRPHLDGAVRSGRVLAAFPTALYLALDAHDHVVPVLTRDALLLPTGLRLACTSRDVRWGVEPGDDVPVGGGQVVLPAMTVVGVRALRPSRVGLPDGPSRVEVPAHAAALRSQHPGEERFARSREVLAEAGVSQALRELGADLARSVLAGTDVTRSLRGLVGAGQGLTPSGDDTVCGVLLTLRGLGVTGSAFERLRAGVVAALPRTTSLSASLLRAAADGYALPEVVRLVRAVLADDAARSATCLPAVLAAGHTSGADLVAGLLGTLDATAPHSSPSFSLNRPLTQPEGAHRG